MQGIISTITARLNNILYILPVLLIALPIHEFSHAYVAYLLGDPTAKNMHRLTINPLRHLDPIGGICLLLFGFGWAKPVPINSYNFKNRRGGMALSAIAGPISNFLMGFIGLVIIRIFYFNMNDIVYTFLSDFAFVNFCLAIFNLIPIVPLDGSRILSFFIPESAAAWLDRYEQYIQIIVIILLVFGAASTYIGAAATNIYNNFSILLGFPT